MTGIGPGSASAGSAPTVRSWSHCAADGGELHCISVSLPAGTGTDLGAWVVDVPSALTACLQEQLALRHADLPVRVAVLIAWQQSTSPLARRPVVAAVRGLVLSLAQELAPSATLNVVVIGTRPPPAIQPVLNYLASRDGAHTTMATLEIEAG
jgi:hypothetical protein